jgi:hemerythrin
LKKDKKFVFNVFKTAKILGTQEIEICEDLMKILKKYLKHHPLKKDPEYFLIYEGDVSSILKNLFGKNVGVSMMRNIMLSGEYSEKVKKAKELYAEIADVAKQMGTSLNTALETYIKPDV